MTDQIVDVAGSEAVTPESDPLPAEPGEVACRDSERVAVVVLSLVTAAAVALLLARLHTVDLHAMTGLGLISVLPVPALAGLGLLAFAFLGALSLRRPHIWLLGAQLGLLVIVLHGITSLLEDQPRFPIAWVHAGFVEYIGRTGTMATDLDARWCWPGFFAVAAFLAGTGRLETLSPVMTAMPVVSNLFYLVAIGLFLSAFRLSWQAKWLAAWLFCVLNWIGQDYFSPQGTAYLLYLLFIGFLVKWFRTADHAAQHLYRRGRTARLWRKLWGTTTSGEMPAAPASPTERVTVLAIVVGLFAAATVTHQLTPFMMVMSAAALIVARRCSLTGLPVLLTVILMAWISYLTEPYWTGHLKDMIGSVGDVGGTVSSSVVARASRGSDEHQLVGQARMLTAGLLFLMVGLGLVRRRRRGIEDRVLLVLVTVPIGLVFMQSYGGEIAFRVYLFALAPACVLAASAFFPDPVSRPSLRARAAGLCLLVLPFSFLITRYGNEQFEQVSDGAVAAVQAVYALTPAGGRFLVVTPQTPMDTPFMPIGYRDVERVNWVGAEAPIDPADMSGLLQALRNDGPGTYLITTRSQEDYLTFGAGYPPGWGQRFRRALAATPELRLVVDNAEAAVYTLNWRPGDAPKPLIPPSTGLQVRRTPWTPVGVVFLGMVLGILGVREAWRVCPAPDGRRRLRPLTVAALPVLIGLVLVIVERFVVLAT